jgi:hypothetical protein
MRPALQTLVAPTAPGGRPSQTHANLSGVELRKRAVSWSSLIDVSLSDANADLELTLDNHKALVISAKLRRRFL